MTIEAAFNRDEKERMAVETVIAGVLYMHDAKRWAQPAAAPKPKAWTGRTQQ